ncbi:integrase catalytic domain-containing protein [Trichonephila clavipes]|nr:integrase catalytic domain-containing protein [Trichonephila clavipes]
MSSIDDFPDHISTTVVPVTLPKKPDSLEYVAQQGQVKACIIYQKPYTKRCLYYFVTKIGIKKVHVDNFKCAMMKVKHVNEFRPDDMTREKVSKGLLKIPHRPLKNTDKSMVYIYGNMFIVKKDFTFGSRMVKPREVYLIQTSNVPMLIYELPASSLKFRAKPNPLRRSFETYDQMLYRRIVLEQHTAYPIQAGTSYILLTFQRLYLVWTLSLNPFSFNSLRMDLT